MSAIAFGRDAGLEGIAWLGLLAGIAGFLVVALAPAPPSIALYGALTPQEFTAWIGAICSGVLALVNTGFIIYHRFRRPKRPKPKRPTRPAPGE